MEATKLDYEESSIVNLAQGFEVVICKTCGAPVHVIISASIDVVSCPECGNDIAQVAEKVEERW